jgi:hypothetical protein
VNSIFSQRRYLILLVALFILLIVQPFATLVGRIEFLFDLLLVLIMSMLGFALAHDRVWRTVAGVAVAAVAILLLGGRLLSATAFDVSSIAGHAIGALFFLAVAGMIVRSILMTRELTWDSLFGAICGYLLIGVAAGIFYAMIYVANPASFSTSEAVSIYLANGNESRNLFMYYSFVTLTTVGFGDITPLSISARTVTWVEAVSGQLYSAILIAGLISALVAKNTKPLHRV